MNQENQNPQNTASPQPQPPVTVSAPTNPELPKDTDLFHGLGAKLEEKFHLRPHHFLAILACGFVIASLVMLFGNSEFADGKHYFTEILRPIFWVLFAVCSGALGYLCCALKSFTPAAYVMLPVSTLYACALAAIQNDDIYFNIGLAVILILVVRYLTSQELKPLSGFKMTPLLSLAIVGVSFAFFVAFVYKFTSLKYDCYAESTYDFGIFAQMFEQMAKTGLPLTTVERAGLVSHFTVHFSPAFYLLLPGYLIFRSPYYLFFAQAFVVGAGAFAAWLIARHFKFSPLLSCVCGLIYLFYPTLANGCFYDFHENKMLTVFLLFAIYFILEKKNIPAIVFTIITLGVKEDAAIYIIALGLCLLLSNIDRKRGTILMVGGVLYFAFACGMIILLGGEIMMGRLEDYYPAGDASFFAVIKVIFYDIGYLVKQVFTEKKLQFAVWTLLPVLFAPFWHKKASVVVLLLPMLVINLMPSWQYQYDIDYQYTYGVAALILFSLFLTLAQSTARQRHFLAAASLSLCMVFSVSATSGKVAAYPQRMQSEGANFQAMDELIENFKTNIYQEGESVSVSAFIMPHLYDLDDLTTFRNYYEDMTETTYYFVDIRYVGDKNYNPASFLGAKWANYELIDEGGYIQLYKLKNA